MIKQTGSVMLRHTKGLFIKVIVLKIKGGTEPLYLSGIML
jgi:hypothetical protein